MNKAKELWAKNANLLPPAKRPARLEHNPVKTTITTATLAIPVKTIRRICRASSRSHLSNQTDLRY